MINANILPLRLMVYVFVRLCVWFAVLLLCMLLKDKPVVCEGVVVGRFLAFDLCLFGFFSSTRIQPNAGFLFLLFFSGDKFLNVFVKDFAVTGMTLKKIILI